ncbi:hypothetical protein, partial [Chelativorans intermedius]
PRLHPLLTPPNDGTQKENRLDLRVALKKGAGHCNKDCKVIWKQICSARGDGRRGAPLGNGAAPPLTAYHLPVVG